jgi:hypothetical protein
MKWLVMDMCSLTFDDQSFDVVLDKCAMDALLVDEGISLLISILCVPLTIVH